MQTTIRIRIAIAALAGLAAAPLFSQEGAHRSIEVYAMGSYSRISEVTNPYLFGSPQRVNAGGSFFGAGFGGRLGLIGLQTEFLQSRMSGAAQIPCLNTGALNFVLEKRTGRIRPGGIAGAGGTQDAGNPYLFFQAGVGVTVMLTHSLYIRPQVRVQDWERLGVLLDFHHRAVSTVVAIGYRFPGSE
jgi:hypothetical protein